ncbi:hypothetical protein C922_01699 [Plasmodium inui San Antonio 1]|uniref:Uncharacterized protein n=1 Tax=Plasmodium inui San Antonio 1 TaxID=1237626 RepID=W7A4T4_9APIC|nr:hypothetical protein C922_01699 [Plasmodium inui San Antonio 1]EUD68087.1 hypothetical protein C922_01699 [Plasmodium inui San Antonio 1]
MRLKDGRAAKNSMTNPKKKKKKKEEILFEYIRNNNSEAVQLLNCIWLYCFYQNIKTLGKNVRVLQNGKGNGPLLVKDLLTLRMNINDAYEYFQTILSTALKIYGEKKDEYISHMNHVVGRQGDYSGHAPLSDVYSGDTHLKDLSFGEDSYVNNVIDILYARESDQPGEERNDQKGEQRHDRHDDQSGSSKGEREALHSRLEIVRICISNIFKILGDLHRYKCYFFEEKKKKNEMKACLNYYKALSYYRYSGHLFNQLTLLYTTGNPIKCLFFYFLSLIAVKPAPNRDAVVMYMESVLSGGKGLVKWLARLRGAGGSGSVDLGTPVSNPCNGETSCKLGRGIFYIKTKERHFLPSIKGSENEGKDTIYHQRERHHDKVNPRAGKKHTDGKKEGSSNGGHGTTKENLAEKELNEAIFNFYMSYFKIVKLLFSKINMNKFEKKKNKFIYYTNRYIKLQYYNSRREDTLMLKNIILIIFTLLSLVIYVITNQHDQGYRNPRGSFFYGNVNVSKYVYKNEQIYFSFLLIHELLLSCEDFYTNFFPSYLSVFIYTLYWFRNEPSVWEVDLDRCTEEDNRERDHLVKQYHEDYRGKSVYGRRAIRGEKNTPGERTTLHSSAARRPPWERRKGEPPFSKQNRYNQVVEDPCDDPEFAHNKDIIKSIKELLMGIKVKEEIPLNDTSLLRYKLREDFYIYPFLSGLQFSSVDGGGNHSAEKGCKVASSQWSSLSNVAYQQFGSNHVDIKCNQLPFERNNHRGGSHLTNFDDSNEEDVVLLKNPLFVKASSLYMNGQIVDPRDDASKGINCYNDLYEMSAISGNNVHSSERQGGSNGTGHTYESASANDSQGRNSSGEQSDDGVALNRHRMCHPKECSKRDHYIAAVVDIPNDEPLEEVADHVRIMRFRSLTQGVLNENEKQRVYAPNACKEYLATRGRGEIRQDHFPNADGIAEMTVVEVPHVADTTSRGRGSQEYTTPIGAEVCKNEMSCTMSRSDDDNKTGNVMSDHTGSYRAHPNGGINQNDYFNYPVLESFHQVRSDDLGSMPNGNVENDDSCKDVMDGRFNSSNEMTKGSDEASLGANSEDLSYPSSPMEADSSIDAMTQLVRIPFQADDFHKGEGKAKALMGKLPKGQVPMDRITSASCKRDSSSSPHNYEQPHQMRNGTVWVEEGNPTLQKMVILDGKNIGTRYQDNYNKYFDPFRIKVVLDYYRFKKYQVKIVIPQEYVMHGRNDLLGKNPNRDYYPLQVQNSSEGEDFILTGNALLFFQNLHILGCLIVHPLESYYAFCVNLVQRWNSCFVTNVTLSELNMKVHELEQPPLKSIASHFISYTFLGDEFLPNPTFRWPAICKVQVRVVSASNRERFVVK